MKFTLEIGLGNDAMQTANDVSDALEQTALNITRRVTHDRIFTPDSGIIRDVNGKNVGKWEVQP